MSVRVRYAVNAAVSSSVAEERDLGNVRLEAVTDAEIKGGTWKTRLLASQTDVQLHLDNITTAQLLIIRTVAADPNQTPQGITIKRNGIGNEAILIKPLADTKEGLFMISTDNLTSIYASNTSSVDMDLILICAGV